MTPYGRIDYSFISIELDATIRTLGSGTALIEYVLPMLTGTNFRSRAIRSIIVGDYISTKYANVPAYKILVL